MRHRAGLTLLELLVVLVILVALAGLIVPLVGGRIEETKETITLANFQELRDVILGRYRSDMNRKLPRPGTYGLSQGRPDKPQLRYLFLNPDLPSEETATVTYDPAFRLGWNGPYLMSTAAGYKVDAANGFTTDFGKDGDPTVLDGWRRPIVLVENTASIPTTVKLVSAGQDGILGNSDDLDMGLLP